jgi:hypothetical protein
MASPFPGMDPFLEQPDVWLDFHNNLAVEIQGRLNAVIPPAYYAGLGSYVTYDVLDVQLGLPAPRRAIRPDVDVWQSRPDAGRAEPAAVIATPPSNTAAVPVEVPVELWSVEVHSAANRELVTVVEVLSPVNRRPGHPANTYYLRKRSEILRSPVHLLEIDLLRAGERAPLLPAPPATPYYAMLSRAETRPEADVWPIELADRLPVLAVPLRPPDADVPLDLGAAVAAVYERGGYATRIDYTAPPPPPLDAAYARWVESTLGPPRTE